MKMLLKVWTHALQANYNLCQLPPEFKDKHFLSLLVYQNKYKFNK